ncbi:hypothetical protein PPL_04893 [Heterostelium album PN500]|uniref:Retrotransposon gag domain-containing protein n=1 Tax=Heterostelium pallidum (strain ATCC 26659 / Pp 5 / PN500) TaxID=670386 RepID=D3B8V0_HETP5|nr:hypothetical protein PPL_04893 [Heterostelium album PN500]EFA82468.1 hypothetical protein PPL_04893 [Heterostelium album PN500]|eukprot:XP_020434585.1 hypothetical protein PPL_04893 [Heterostelium album PN500]
MDTDRVLKDQQHIDRLDDLQAVHGDFRKEHRNLIFEKDFLKFDPKMPDVDVFITNIKTYIQTSQYPTSPFYIYLLARRIFPAEYHKGLNLNNREGMTLKELCTAIRHKCTSKPLIEYKKDFENLVQGNMSVVEYMTAFNNLEIYCCELNTAGLQRKFLEGLRKDIFLFFQRPSKYKADTNSDIADSIDQWTPSFSYPPNQMKSFNHTFATLVLKTRNIIQPVAALYLTALQDVRNIDSKKKLDFLNHYVVITD